MSTEPEPTNQPIFNWGHPGHIVAEWERRGDEEGIGFECRAFDHPLQYKIDIWTLKEQRGNYRMRLDGFGHLRWFNEDSLQELIAQLMNISVTEVIAASRQMSGMHRKAYNAWKDKPEGNNWPEPPPEVPELVIAEYFEAARQRTLQEMHPLLHFGDN
jgi:hypothetical protein